MTCHPRGRDALFSPTTHCIIEKQIVLIYIEEGIASGSPTWSMTVAKQHINLSNILDLKQRAKAAGASEHDVSAFNQAFYALDQAVEQINGRATSFTMSSWNILNLVLEAEKWLDKHDLPKKVRPGARVFHRPSGPSANSYKYNAATTEVVLERRSSGWVLLEIKRGTVRPKQGATTRYIISETTRDVIVRNALAGTEVRSAA
jgi:hypothetical protein